MNGSGTCLGRTTTARSTTPCKQEEAGERCEEAAVPIRAAPWLDAVALAPRTSRGQDVAAALGPRELQTDDAGASMMIHLFTSFF